MNDIAPADLVWWTLLAGLGGVGATVILRNAPVIRGWVQDAKRPWACNVCMPLYTTAAMLAIPIAQTGDWRYAASYLPAYGLAYLTLEKMGRPPGPPQIPEEFLRGDT